MKNQLNYYIWITILILCFNSCNIVSNQTKMKKLQPQTLEVDTRFYTLLKNKDYESIYNLFSEENHKKNTYDKVIRSLNGINNRHGNLKTYEYLYSEYSTEIENGVETNTITNFYKVMYTDGFLSRERLLYELPREANNVKYIDEYGLEKYEN